MLVFLEKTRILKQVNIYFLDLIGTFAFAFYGAYQALQYKFDIFGIIACAFLTALGGGTIRELMLAHQPAYFSDPHYMIAIFIGSILAILCFHSFKKINYYMLILDAVGLVAFAYIGAEKAAQAELGLHIMILFAVLSAAGGGILTDLITNRKPRVFYQDFYASPAIILACGYFCLGAIITTPLITYGLLVVVFAIRIIAVVLQIGLWRPSKRVAFQRIYPFVTVTSGPK